MEDLRWYASTRWQTMRPPRSTWCSPFLLSLYDRAPATNSPPKRSLCITHFFTRLFSATQSYWLSVVQQQTCTRDDPLRNENQIFIVQRSVWRVDCAAIKWTTLYIWYRLTWFYALLFGISQIYMYAYLLCTKPVILLAGQPTYVTLVSTSVPLLPKII